MKKTLVLPKPLPSSKECRHTGCENMTRVRQRTRGTIVNTQCASCEHNLRKYNMTTPERDGLLSLQGGCCKICDSQIEFRKVVGNNTYTAVVDHCHNTGEIRGILCSRCNLMLGTMEDDIEVLQSAIEYLK
jgi:hypothetical protein